ncbi:MAG: EAL domain-containing protein [Lachnospiraceae bacterium]|nr:EAL domain-containing protein [Lachnospiraceae bacterium]
MSILSQCCGLTLLATIVYFYSFRRKILIKTGQNYLQLVFATLICTLFDMLSIFCINHEATLPAIFVEIICKAYVASLVSVSIFGLRYLCADVYKHNKEYKKAMIRVYSIWILMIAVIFALPIYVAYDESGVAKYTEGPSTLATYICVAIVIIMIVVTTETNKRIVNINRRKVVYIWIAAWVVAALIQFFNNELLIVSFGAALGVTIIYFALENPESNLDRNTGFFNENALGLYANQHFNVGRRFSLVYVEISPYRNGGKKLSLEADIQEEINRYVMSFEKGDIFIINESEYCMAFESKENANDALELVRERFNYGWGVKKNVILPTKYMYVPNSMEFEGWESLSQAIRFIGYSSSNVNDVNVVTPSSLTDLVKEREIEEIIRDAIDNDRIEAFYQPIYSVKENRFVSAEALARIRREDGSIVPPGLFIPVAEKNGTIIKIGEIVFEKTCQLLSREMLHERFDVDYIEINLSTVQCSYECLADSFVAIMNKNHVDPTWINLEITETGSLAEKNILLRNMNELMIYGVTFSLDDFGTGNSNLNYIMDMPVRIVKFDREMISAYFVNDKARHIMTSTIKMLLDMGFDIVAEGVENKEQSEEIRKLGVSYIQGYYYSKPLTRGDYINFLETGTNTAEF